MKNFFLYALAALLGGAIALGSYKMLEPEGQSTSVNLSPASARMVNYVPNNGTPTAPPFDFTYAAERTLPSVVHIQSTQNRRCFTMLSV
ncbi:MAG: hypothetical protein H6573_31245 [Lewinellaceae bacterium]|nr:hypothetical protein [Phaeodactylibacter sp.]MCB9351934.1 hypothetical protein [Lewinellaceae bacterium]